MSYLNLGVVLFKWWCVLEREDIAQHFKAKLFIVECVEISTVFKISSLNAPNSITVFCFLNIKSIYRNFLHDNSNCVLSWKTSRGGFSSSLLLKNTPHPELSWITYNSHCAPFSLSSLSGVCLLMTDTFQIVHTCSLQGLVNSSANQLSTYHVWCNPTLSLPFSTSTFSAVRFSLEC